MKILSIVGARPQFIKEASIQKEFKKYPDIEQILVHTGQHYDKNMSDIFFDTLEIEKPKYNLGINYSNHGEMTGHMLIKLEKIFIKEKPDIVLLYGDTNSTLSGALAASKLNIPICHIEAGLRQKPHNMPEEINRVVTDKLSNFLFCPSKLSIENLNKEGIYDGVFFSGDVMYDIFLKMKPKFSYEYISKLNLQKNKYVVMTLHRDFNVDDPNKLKRILQQVNLIGKNIKIIFSLHPRTKKRILEFSFKDLIKNINIIEPIDYLSLMGLVEYSNSVITDSGGLQKEAYFLKKRAYVIMPDTSWRELIDNGFNRLVSEYDLYDKFSIDENIKYINNIYGEGNASEIIVNILRKTIF